MMFCPKCEEEFPDTAPTCSDCNVELVSSLKEDELPVSWKIYPFMQGLLQSQT